MTARTKNIIVIIADLTIWTVLITAILKLYSMGG